MPSLESMVLNRVAPMTQKRVAELIGVEPTNFSRFLNNSGHNLPFAKVCQLLDVLELDVVAPGDGSTVCLPREEYEALKCLAKKALGGV
ncbi:CII family transcriptional regulator [Cupriavidus basilensis]|nr:CII family transcriptional regulator [Cupriavidus basilensis]